MLKVVKKKVRTSLPAVYRSKESGALVLFFKPCSGVCLNGVYVSKFDRPGLDCVSDPEWERVKVKIKALPVSKGYSFPTVLQSKKDGTSILFLGVYVGFVLNLEGCDVADLRKNWNYVECVNSDDWEAVDLTFK